MTESPLYRPEELQRIDRAYGEVLASISRAALRVGRAPKDVTLVAVSKTYPASSLQALIECVKLRGDEEVTFGESRVKEFKEKRPLLAGAFTAHFIGPLQSNKANDAVRLFDMLESVDSSRLAGVVAKAAGRVGTRQEILLQVNISGDPAKGGFSPDELLDFLRTEGKSYTTLVLRGLMTITRYYEEREEARGDFRRMGALRSAILSDPSLRSLFPGEKCLLSMGMSRDFDIAIEEGASHVRVGTAIFGVREGNQSSAP
jgi:pyridoxal phosphate enzyme (YggS family)